MKMSKLYLPTLKETPKDATIDSHILMLRSGLARKSASGLYSYLPLGYRTLKKIIQIVRDEMDRTGGQEFLLPILTSRELWEETGRYEMMGNLMFRLQDRHHQDFVLGPTHEEAFTDVLRNEINSYRQLPVIVYQVQKKFRDEIRPRFGVMRGREFFMKDAYSYHESPEDLDKTYQDMRKAYRRFFLRCGLDTVPVNADSGAMGGKASEEFMVRSHIGEETIIECPECGYIANVERADAHRSFVHSSEEAKEMEKIHTPNVRTIEELTDFLKIGKDNFIKTLLYQSEDGEKIAVLIRGDLDVNEVKLANAMGGKEFFLTDENTIREITGAPVGFAGPVGLKDVKIIADRSVEYMRNAVTGANEKDYHIKNVNPGRDFEPEVYADIKLTVAGDPCPECKTPVRCFEGIELGHIFKLGYKYTKDMGFQYQDQNGNSLEPIMGCYGIGVDRTMAAVIEQNNDKDGIIWPVTIAPYEVSLLALGNDTLEEAEKIYNQLLDRGIDVLFDDRDARPGFKFKDADLIGIPIRITLGKKSLQEGMAEVKLRREGEMKKVPLETLAETVETMIREEKEKIRKQVETVSV
jgi:prolyl-tRNA synthetase